MSFGLFSVRFCFFLLRIYALFCAPCTFTGLNNSLKPQFFPLTWFSRFTYFFKCNFKQQNTFLFCKFHTNFPFNFNFNKNTKLLLQIVLSFFRFDENLLFKSFYFIHIWSFEPEIFSIFNTFSNFHSVLQVIYTAELYEHTLFLFHCSCAPSKAPPSSPLIPLKFYTAPIPWLLPTLSTEAKEDKPLFHLKL